MGDGGIVDGQNLQDALTCISHPVDHLPQVTEVTHAEALTTPQ